MGPASKSAGFKRAGAFILVAGLLGVPALTLRAFCVGRSCESSAKATTTTPFCSLPPEIRQAISQGTREGRSPEILAVTSQQQVIGTWGPGTASETPWPSVEGPQRVPIVLSGMGIAATSRLPDDAGLDDIAPTLASVIKLDRAHPEVRTGVAMQDALDPTAEPPRLVVMVALKGVGTESYVAEEWRQLNKLAESGAATDAGSIMSGAGDPVASMTTIGTGGSPAQHGMTAEIVRDEQGDLVEAWGMDSPINVIATFGDDLDNTYSDQSVVALVGTQAGDKGLIGGRWYPDGDKDLVSILPEESSAEEISDQVAELFETSPLGRDSLPDLLGVALEGTPDDVDAAIGRLANQAKKATDGRVTFAIAGTGDSARTSDAISARELRRLIEQDVSTDTPLVEALVPGGIYVDQAALAAEKLSDDAVLKALFDMKARDGSDLFADVFPAVAVTFGRFC